MLAAEQNCTLSLFYILMDLLSEDFQIECLFQKHLSIPWEAAWYCREFEDKSFILDVHIRRKGVLSLFVLQSTHL